MNGMRDMDTVLIAHGNLTLETRPGRASPAGGWGPKGLLGASERAGRPSPAPAESWVALSMSPPSRPVDAFLGKQVPPPNVDKPLQMGPRRHFLASVKKGKGGVIAS